MELMYCIKCGSLMKPGANFCTVCGAKVPEGQSGNDGFQDMYLSNGPIDDTYKYTNAPQGDGGRRGGGISRYAIVALVLAVVAIVALGTVSNTYSDNDSERNCTVGDFIFYGGMVSEDITASDTISGTMLYTGDSDNVFWKYKVLSATYLVKTPYGYYDERGYETVSGSSLTFSEPGNYSVQLYVDGSLHSEGRAVLNGTVTTTYSWHQTVDGKYYSYSVALTYDFSDYYKYASMENVVRQQSLRLNDNRFAVVDDPILDLEDALSAEYLRVRGSSMSQTGHEYADYILSFVQCAIRYPDMVEKLGSHWYYDENYGVGDVFLNGQEEYWSYPMETLYLGYGDCEDTSFLACSLFSAAGYKSAVVTLENHMMAAVHLDSIASNPDSSYYMSGYATLNTTKEKMYYCETTYESAIPAGFYNTELQPELSKITEVSVVQPYKRATA